MADSKMHSGQNMVWKQGEIPTVYANLMGFGFSAFDITIIFGELGDASATEVNGTPKVKVMLVSEQAANLQKLLGVALRAYVENHGSLRNSGAVDVDELTRRMEDQKVKVKL